MDIENGLNQSEKEHAFGFGCNDTLYFQIFIIFLIIIFNRQIYFLLIGWFHNCIHHCVLHITVLLFVFQSSDLFVVDQTAKIQDILACLSHYGIIYSFHLINKLNLTLFLDGRY